MTISEQTIIDQIAAWLEDQAARERDLIDSGQCTNPALVQERWLVYKAAVVEVRAGSWRKKP